MYNRKFRQGSLQKGDTIGFFSLDDWYLGLLNLVHTPGDIFLPSEYGDAVGHSVDRKQRRSA